jgi:DNA-binding MarR family transcriptional regulator
MAEPLTPDEEVLWRAINKIMIALPRALDSDLVRGAGLTLPEYGTLMNLSEAERREMRMTDLASATGLSPSRITRLVDDLQSRGLVSKRRSADDGRGNVASLTDKGLAKLEESYPEHLESARNRVTDHVSPSDVRRVSRSLANIADHLED